MPVNPQKEHGYTSIANELMEALASYSMPGNHWRCLLCILRFIYGYKGKYAVRISNARISEITKIKRPHVSKIMNDLVKHKILNVTVECNIRNDVTLQSNIRAKTFVFNKHYDQWSAFRDVTVERNSFVTLHGNDSDFIPIIGKQKTIYPQHRKKEPKLQFKKKVPLPQNFTLTEQMKKYANSKRYCGNLNELTEDFCIYHKKKKTKFADWYAAWQSWIRNDIKWNPQHIKPKQETREERLERLNAN